MPEIEEYDVVIKTITVDELKALFGEGIKDVRIKFQWNADTGQRTMINSSMKVIVETWQPKVKKP